MMQFTRSGYIPVVDVRLNVALTAAERAELSAWITTGEFDEIVFITIDQATVTIRGRLGSQPAMSASVVRYRGRLSGSLDEALATLRNVSRVDASVC